MAMISLVIPYMLVITSSLVITSLSDFLITNMPKENPGFLLAYWFFYVTLQMINNMETQNNTNL